MRGRGHVFLFLLGSILDSCCGVAILNGSLPLLPEPTNASRLIAKNIIDKDTLRFEIPKAKVTAIPLEIPAEVRRDFREHSTVKAVPLEQNSGIFLQDDADLGLSQYVAQARTGGCGFKLTDLKIGDKGYIRSPNYPGQYDPDQKCTWWLKAKDNGRVLMTCTDVMTQSCDAGFYDYILVSPDWSWEKYYLLCGDYNQYTPFTLTSTENYLSIYFRSSPVRNFRGFECNYEIISDIASLPSTTTTTTTPAPEEQEEYAVDYNGDEGCGLSPASSRIVGGHEVAPNSYPWMVGLSFNSQWFCGGTLLNKEWVLTAAHCTDQAATSYVYLGAHNLYNEEANRQILFSETFYEHPDYDTESIENDVALVKLPAGALAEYTDHIRPACLPPLGFRAEQDLADTSLYAIGWGKTENGATISPVLNQLEVKIVSNEECMNSYGDIIKPTNLCAQGVNGTGTCQGDSGSSLQSYDSSTGRWIQYGVVSFGASTGCGTGYPNGYSSVTKYLQFITEITGIQFK